MEKRSITLSGHRTSIALEREFWEALELIAAERSLSLAALIAEIDAGAGGGNLTSAIRVAALRWFRDR